MSTSYDIHCRDCGEWVPDWRDASKLVWRGEDTCLNDYRDGESLKVVLSSLRPHLESLGTLMAGNEFWRFTDHGGDLMVLMRFFGQHAGHSLFVQDEYGNET